MCLCVLRHAEKTWKNPCVDSKTLRVSIQNVLVCTGTTPTCATTCVRGAGTHGDVSNVHTGRFEWTHGGHGGHRQFCLPEFAHVWLSRASEVHQRNFWIFPIFKFENRLSSVYLIKLFSFSNLEGNFGPDGSISLSPSPPHLPPPPLPPPPPQPQPRAPQQHTTHRDRNTHTDRETERQRETERARETEKEDKTQISRTIRTSDTFHDVRLQEPLTFHDGFMFFGYIS